MEKIANYQRNSKLKYVRSYSIFYLLYVTGSSTFDTSPSFGPIAGGTVIAMSNAGDISWSLFSIYIVGDVTHTLSGNWWPFNIYFINLETYMITVNFTDP